MDTLDTHSPRGLKLGHPVMCTFSPASLAGLLARGDTPATACIIRKWAMVKTDTDRAPSRHEWPQDLSGQA